MSTEPAGSSDGTATAPPRTRLRISMDNEAISAAGVAMMSTATALRGKYAATGPELAAMLDDWTGPDAAAFDMHRADMDAGAAAARARLDRIHSMLMLAVHAL